MPVLVFALQPSLAAASGTLSLASPQAGQTVSIGQTLNIRLDLAGLDSGEQLDLLAAAVLFPSDKLSVSAPSIAAGNLVPSPLDDPLDFQASLGSAGPGIGQVDVFYGTFSASHLLSTAGGPGTFLSFNATVLAPGSISLSIDGLDATRFQFQPGDPVEANLSAGGSLSFTAVPEPATWFCGIIGLSVVFTLRVKRA